MPAIQPSLAGRVLQCANTRLQAKASSGIPR